jgi:hypothetical protein
MSTIYNYYQFSVSSVFDPLFTTGGGSATGFSQWMQLYNYCFVNSVLVTFTVSNTSPISSSNGLIMFIVPVPNSQSPSPPTATLDLARETPGSVFYQLGSGPSAHNPHTLNKAYTIKQIDGIDSPRISYSCTASADPEFQPTLMVGVLSSDGVTTGLTYVYDVVLTYNCTLWQRRIFATP